MIDNFTFHNPGLVRRFGTLLVVGTAFVLLLLTLLLTSVARNGYASMDTQRAAIAQAEAATERQGNAGVGITFYESETPQLAQSQMQSDMQALADQNQVQLEVIRADQVEQLQGALRLTLTLNGVVAENQLGGFLESLASHDPMIVVDSIVLRRGRSSSQGIDDRPLAIQLKLSGFTPQ